MNDRNDPEHLALRMFAIKEEKGCTLAQAADYLYEDMSRQGYWLAPVARAPNGRTYVTVWAAERPLDPAPTWTPSRWDNGRGPLT